MLCAALCAAAQSAETPVTTSTRAAAELLMERAVPSLEADTAMTPQQFLQWRQDMSTAMARIMKHPGVQAAPPVRVARAKRPGYTIEKWQSSPFEGVNVPFLVLIPDGVSAANPAPAVLCIPGFGQTKELLAGEMAGKYNLEQADTVMRQAAQALHFVKEGLVAVAVDNPSCGELSDNGVADYVTSSRFLLELGWSYLGLASWQDKLALDWLKGRPDVRRDRVIVSGFSLGTEPLMVLGLLDDEIYAFVYNDFLCRTRERALTMNKPDANGRRPYPNNDEHLIPEFLTTFDFPDIVAALAPRPVICTEGGMDRDFGIIAKVFDIAGAPENFEYHHYAKCADPANRVPLEKMPSGIDRNEFFRLANVDSPNHYFKTEWILPWLRKILAEDATGNSDKED